MTPPTNSAAEAAVAASTASVPVPAITFAPAGGERGSDSGEAAVCRPCPSDEVVGLLGCAGGGGVGVVGGADGEVAVVAVCRPCPSNEDAGVVGAEGDGTLGVLGSDGGAVVVLVYRSCHVEEVLVGAVCRSWPGDADVGEVARGLAVGFAGGTGDEGRCDVWCRPCLGGKAWELPAGGLVDGSPTRTG